MKKIKLDNFELKMIIKFLNELRTQLLNQNKELILLTFTTILEK